MTKTAIALDRSSSWLHEAFLARAAEPDNEEGRHALGAFLTLRLADRFDPSDEPPHPLALAYQVRATRDYLTDLEPQNVEATHLQQVVRMADAVQQGSSRAILWPPLLAYASWLEQQLWLPEALDVVDTALRLDDGTAPTEEIAALLQRGRILRLLGQLEEAKASYEAARVKAVAKGDTHSQLLGRIGQAIVMRQVGNLRKSEAELRAIIRDAQAAGDANAEARARHDLGVALTHQRNGQMAVPELYRAFELYDKPSDRLRALSDVGEALKVLGAYAAAEDAFLVVLSGNANPQMRAATMEELLEVSALRGNRLAFQSWRRQLENLGESLPVPVRADMQLALGLGYQLFGNRKKAEQHLSLSMRLSEEHGLNEVLMRAEAGLESLRANAVQKGPPVGPSWTHDDPVTEVVEKLHALRSA